MTEQPFSVSVDPDDLARRNIAAALGAVPGGGGDGKVPPAIAAHHGAGDVRQAARERSERSHAGRGAKGGGRTYAFRRS